MDHTLGYGQHPFIPYTASVLIGFVLHDGTLVKVDFLDQ